MHDVAIVRVTSKNIWDYLAESLREDALVNVLDSVVNIFLCGTHAAHHISVVHSCLGCFACKFTEKTSNIQIISYIYLA